MDFWEAKNAETVKKEFGTQRLILSSKTSVISLNRPATSLSAIQNKSKEIGLNQALFLRLNAMESRYVMATGITFDLLVSIYDVNSNSAILVRATWPLDSKDLERIRGMIKRLKRPNIEIRAIGMQNGDLNLIKIVDELYNVIKGNLIEVDLFGSMERHIAIDLKTGMSYDILLEDRIYRPGELLNTVTQDNFKSKVSKVKFL